MSEDRPIGNIKRHFLDSGSFSQCSLARQYAASKTDISNGPLYRKYEREYYDSEAFYKFMDDYAFFLKGKMVWAPNDKKMNGKIIAQDEPCQYETFDIMSAVDYYANVDAIGFADISHRNLIYLKEKHGLDPVPVVHFGTDPKWIKRYIKEGYKFLALGGLVGSLANTNKGNEKIARLWLNDCFRVICHPKTGLPRVRVHGFGVSALAYITSYPWWSIDSTTWTQVGGFGAVTIPSFDNHGNFFLVPDGTHKLINPTNVQVSSESYIMGHDKQHWLNFRHTLRGKMVKRWLKRLGIQMGRYNLPWHEIRELASQGLTIKEMELEVVENGVIVDHSMRRLANLLYFEELRKALPKYPQPWFPPKQAKRLGLLK